MTRALVKKAYGLTGTLQKTNMKQIKMEYTNGSCVFVKPKTIEGHKAIVKVMKLLLDRGQKVTVSVV